MHMRFTFVMAAAALVLSACGGEPATVAGIAGGGEDAPTAGTDGSAASATQDAAANAEANQPILASSDNVLDTEVLVVADGSITTLVEAATGDRPLLVWFWAPH